MLVIRLILAALLVVPLAGCLDAPRCIREVRVADVGPSEAHKALRAAATDLGASVSIDAAHAGVVTAEWRATLTEDERRKYASDLNAWSAIGIVTLPLAVGASMYGGGGGDPPIGEDVPASFHCALTAVVVPTSTTGSRIEVLLARPGNEENRRADMEQFWQLVGSRVALRVPMR